MRRAHRGRCRADPGLDCEHGMECFVDRAPELAIEKGWSLIVSSSASTGWQRTLSIVESKLSFIGES